MRDIGKGIVDRKRDRDMRDKGRGRNGSMLNRDTDGDMRHER